MSHERKKSGGRKDKKVERMNEDLAWRKGMAHEPHPNTDQGDIQSYKPGSSSDRNRAPNPNQPQKR